MEWSEKDMWAADVLLKAMLSIILEPGVVAMDGGALDQLGFKVIWSEAV